MSIHRVEHWNVPSAGLLSFGRCVNAPVEDAQLNGVNRRVKQNAKPHGRPKRRWAGRLDCIGAAVPKTGSWRSRNETLLHASTKASRSGPSEAATLRRTAATGKHPLNVLRRALLGLNPHGTQLCRGPGARLCGTLVWPLCLYSER